MSNTDEKANETPRRFRTLRPNPLRDVLPWGAVVVGIVHAVRGGFELAHGSSPLQLLVGLGLAALGIIAFVIYRWQARRGL